MVRNYLKWSSGRESPQKNKPPNRFSILSLVFLVPLILYQYPLGDFLRKELLSLIGKHRFSSVQMSYSSNPTAALSVRPGRKSFNLPGVQFPQLQNGDDGKFLLGDNWNMGNMAIFSSSSSHGQRVAPSSPALPGPEKDITAKQIIKSLLEDSRSPAHHRGA